MKSFSGYHQIPMHSLDAEKTAFITPRRLYCYNVIPFGLKNVRATYQRLVTKIFQPLIGKTMEVYIDDMLVKSKEAQIILLQCNTFWLEKRQSDLSKAGNQDISTADRQDHGSLYRRYARQV